MLAAEFKSVHTEIATDGEKTRRHMDVVFEGLRDSIKAAIDAATDLDEKIDRLIASNAAEHAAFLEAIANLRSQRMKKAEAPSTPP